MAALVFVRFHVMRPGTAFRMVDGDPEIAYLASSLAVFEGRPYMMVQHPGTPVLLAGTALLAVLRPFVAWPRDAFTRRMVEEPELFFMPAHALLFFFNLACLLALARHALSVRRLSDAVLAAAAAAAFFAVVPRAFAWPFYWSHNAAAFPAGTAILLGLQVALRRGRMRPRTAAILGACAGVLAATQLYFATWTAGLVLAILAAARLRYGTWAPAVRPAAAAAGASLAGFLLACLPMISQWRVFSGFVRGLLTHQGAYGTGPAGFTSAGRLLSNLAGLAAHAPAALAAAGLVVVVLAALYVRGPRRRQDAGRWGVALGIAVQLALTVALLAKHPSPNYVPAVAATLPVLLAITFDVARRRPRGARLSLAAAGLILAAFVVNAALTSRHYARRAALSDAMAAEVSAVLAADAAARGVPGPGLVLWGPGLPDAECYLRWMAIQYSDNALAAEVARACPAEGLAWSNSVVLPAPWAQRTEVPATIVTTERALGLFPAFARFGPPRLGAARDISGARVAYLSVMLDRGTARPAAEGPVR